MVEAIDWALRVDAVVFLITLAYAFRYHRRELRRVEDKYTRLTDRTPAGGRPAPSGHGASSVRKARIRTRHPW